MVKSPKNTRQHKESRKQVKKTEASVKWIYILLFSLACLLYANTLRHEYAFDDAVAITENAFTQKGIQGIPDLFQKDLFAGIHGKDLVLGGGRWRPLSLITFALEVQFFGNNPHISHLFNVLLYGLAVVILFMMLQKILPGKLLLNFLVTLLFIVHPVHTEVVANIKSRDELLSFIGLCLAIYWCFKFIESRRMKYLMYSCIAYILALTSKENGITLIALLPILLVYLANKKWKESILTTTPYLAVAAIYLFIRWKMVGLASDKITSIIDNPFLDATVFEKYATIMAILGKYLLLLFFPATLTSDYTYNQIPVIGWGNGMAVVSLLVHGALVVYAAILLIKPKPDSMDHMHHRIASVGIVFYVVTISIVSNIAFNVGAPMAERFLFLPSLGFCIAAVIGMLKLLKTKDLGSLNITGRAVGVFSIVLILFAGRTIARNGDWKNNETLFEADIRNSPNSARLNFGYGNIYRDKVNQTGDWKSKNEAATTAINAYSKALAIYPAYPDPSYNMGLVYHSIGDTANAIKTYLKTLEINPGFALAAINLGAIAFNQKNYPSALKYFEQCIARNPDSFVALYNSGLCYHVMNDYEKAITFYNRAFLIDSTNANLLHSLSALYVRLGDTAKAAYYQSLADNK